MVKSHIYLIRHGDTPGTEGALAYGSTNYHLTENGKKQVLSHLNNGEYPSAEDALLYTSGLIRTEETFELIFGKTQHEIIPDLEELHFGIYENKPFTDLDEDEDFRTWFYGIDIDMTPADGGESFNTYQKRVLKGFDQVMQKHQLQALSQRHLKKPAKSVIVCHGGVISTLLMYYFPEENKDLFQWIPDPGGGYVLTFDNGKFTDYKML